MISLAIAVVAALLLLVAAAYVRTGRLAKRPLIFAALAATAIAVRYGLE